MSMGATMVVGGWGAGYLAFSTSGEYEYRELVAVRRLANCLGSIVAPLGLSGIVSYGGLTASLPCGATRAVLDLIILALQHFEKSRGGA